MKRLVFIAPEQPPAAVLACGLLAALVDQLKPGLCEIICSRAVAGLFTKAPFATHLIVIPEEGSPDDRALAVTNQLAPDPPPEICVNARTLRDPFSDRVVLLSAAEKRIGYGRPGIKRASELPAYTDLALDPGVKLLETQRFRELLKAAGIKVGQITPVIWENADDRTWASEFLVRHQLQSGKFIAFFPEPPHPLAEFQRFAEAILPVCLPESLPVVALGVNAGENGETHIKRLIAGGARVVDARGAVSLAQAVVLLRTARFAVGSENVFAHAACAAGCPHALMLSGGELFRYMPYSPLTSGVFLPLFCFDCGWNCRFEKPYCATAADPVLLQMAMQDILGQEIPDMPRLYYQHAWYGLGPLSVQKKLTQADCYFNPLLMPPMLYDVRLVIPPNLTAFGTPPSLMGCLIRCVTAPRGPVPLE